MRTPYTIAGLIVGAIGIDVLLAWIQPVRLLPVKLCADIGNYGMNASWFLLPAIFVFAPAGPSSKRNWGARIVLSVLTSWYAVIQFRMSFNLPALRELAYRRDDYMYDGVGMNAALFIMGWIPPLVVTVIMVIVYLVLTWAAKTKEPDSVMTIASRKAAEPWDAHESPS